jgi:hypothetical protein
LNLLYLLYHHYLKNLKFLKVRLNLKYHFVLKNHYFLKYLSYL